jgi:N6-L-threonylcarbamoyladenine synthase
MSQNAVILAIETSCDDTAAAVVVGPRLASNVRAAQRIHEGFGGVVPELAGRAHQVLIVPVVEAALSEAGVSRDDLDAVAVTYGPGLAGSLLVGLSFAKAMALALDVPLIGVNHLEGHVYSVFIEEPHPAFPYLCMTVSGGHTQLDVVREGFEHQNLGRTRDDAAGEAFDKVAKMMGLGYPGGPVIDRLATEGDPRFLDFPRTRLSNAQGPFDFSFSGIKTAVLYTLSRMSQGEREPYLRDHTADLAASFQQAVVDVLLGALRDAARQTGIRTAAIVGGVSANRQLREEAAAMARAEGLDLFIPRLEFSMDNAAMIAATARFKLASGVTDPLTLTAAPSLRLGEEALT